MYALVSQILNVQFVFSPYAVQNPFPKMSDHCFSLDEFDFNQQFKFIMGTTSSETGSVIHPGTSPSRDPKETDDNICSARSHLGSSHFFQDPAFRIGGTSTNRPRLHLRLSLCKLNPIIRLPALSFLKAWIDCYRCTSTLPIVSFTLPTQFQYIASMRTRSNSLG